MGVLLEKLFQHFVCAFVVEVSVFPEIDDIRGIYEIVPEKLCENDSVEIFTAACRIVASCMMRDRISDLVEFGGQVEVDPESVDDRRIAFCYSVEHGIDVLARTDRIVAGVQKVCHLVVSGKASARCRGYDIAPRLFRFNDFFHLKKMLRIRKR